MGEGDRRPRTAGAYGRIPQIPVQLVVGNVDVPFNREDRADLEFFAAVRVVEVDVGLRRRRREGQNDSRN